MLLKATITSTTFNLSESSMQGHPALVTIHTFTHVGSHLSLELDFLSFEDQRKQRGPERGATGKVMVK